MITSGIAAHRSTGSTNWLPFFLSHLARAHGELGQVEEAKRCAEEATAVMNVTNERWYEAEIHRTAGEIALLLPDSDLAKAEGISSMHCRLRVNNNPSPGNSAPQ